MIIQISVALALLCFTLVTGLCAVEAWVKSPTQSTLVIFLPGYVIYFALINSERELPFRLLLMASVVLGVVLPVTLEFVQRWGQ